MKVFVTGNSRYLLLACAVLFALFLSACPSGEEVAEQQGTEEAAEVESSPDYILPRTVEGFTMGEEFVLGEGYRAAEPDEFGKTMWNDYEAQGYVNQEYPQPIAGTSKTVAVFTVEGKIYMILTNEDMDEAAAVEYCAAFVQQYAAQEQMGKIIDEENREWHNFDDNFTVVRLERWRGKVTLNYTAFDLNSFLK